MQNLRESAIIEAQKQTFELAESLLHFSPCPIKTLNIGGGFGIPYAETDSSLSISAIAENLASLIAKYSHVFGSTKIILELGRYLVGEAGLYVCEIRDIKISRGTTYLITSGGLHHHLAATGNFGQTIHRHYPILIANKATSRNLQKVSIVGPLCTPLDTLARNITLPSAEVGDLIAVFQSGAYGFTASPHGFLGHPPPLQIFV